MGVPLGVGDALVQEPAIELVVALEAQSRGEEPAADHPDLVLDLPLLPPGPRRARYRLDQVVAAHLQEAPVEHAILTDQDGLHRRLHVVVDPSPAGALEEAERPVVGVEHHLRALSRIGADQEHPAVAQPHVRHLELGRHPRQHHELVAPVELVGLARIEHQRHVRLRHRRRPAPPPRLGVAPDRVVAAAIAEIRQRLEDTLQGQPFALRLGLIGREQSIQLIRPRTQLGSRLGPQVVAECRRIRPDHLAHRVARDLQIPLDRLDRLALDKMLTPNPRNRLHNQHPRHPVRPKRGALDQP